MKKILSTLVLLLVAYFVGAQVTMTDTVVCKSFPKDNHGHFLPDTIINNTPDTITVTWHKLSEQLLTGWTGAYISDPYACYPYAGGSPHSFTLAPGASGVMFVAMIAHPTAANGACYVTLTTNYGDMVFKFEAYDVTNVENANEINLLIFPNPANDILCLNDKIPLNSKIDIINLSGQTIYSTIINYDQKIDIHSLPKGIYYLKVNCITRDYSQFLSFVKQ